MAGAIAIRSAKRVLQLLVPAIALLLVSAGAGRATTTAKNGLILFTSLPKPNGALALETIKPNGTGRRTLAGTKVWPYGAAAWSPNGRQIAFMRVHKASSETSALYVMRADGTHPKRLTNGRFTEHRPAWSPDGKVIVFERAITTGSDLFLIRVDGGGLRRLTQLGNAIAPAWSPDGSTIAFSKAGELFLVDVDGTNVRQATTTGGKTGIPDWSPDGKRFVFGRPNGIWVVNTDGTELTRLLNKRADRPRWSPDGRKVVFESDQLSRGLQQLYVINADGTGEKRLTKRGVLAYAPSWQRIG